MHGNGTSCIVALFRVAAPTLSLLSRQSRSYTPYLSANQIIKRHNRLLFGGYSSTMPEVRTHQLDARDICHTSLA